MRCLYPDSFIEWMYFEMWKALKNGGDHEKSESTSKVQNNEG